MCLIVILFHAENFLHFQVFHTKTKISPVHSFLFAHTCFTIRTDSLHAWFLTFHLSISLVYDSFLLHFFFHSCFDFTQCQRPWIIQVKIFIWSFQRLIKLLAPLDLADRKFLWRYKSRNITLGRLLGRFIIWSGTLVICVAFVS